MNEAHDKSFRQPDESEVTIHHFSAKDPNYKRLIKDDELSKLRQELIDYINDLFNRLTNDISSGLIVSGEKGEKGDKGDTGARGARGAGRAGSLTAGDFLDITDDVITTTYTAGNGIVIDENGVIKLDYNTSMFQIVDNKLTDKLSSCA